MTVSTAIAPTSTSTATEPQTARADLRRAFTGVWVPLVTPFRDGALDVAALEKLVLMLLRQGVDGFVVCGTTGEAATQSESEQLTQLRLVRALAGNVPVIMGVSGADTYSMSRWIERIEAHGASGLLISPPQYVRPSQEGIRLHYEALAAATSLPIVLYNIPYRTGVNMELPTIKALAANPQFVAIKESGGGNLAQLSGLIEQTPLRVLSGEDHLLFVSACMGGHGGITAAAHIRPDLHRRMLAHVAAGNLPAARQLASALSPLISLLFSEPNPGPLKAALEIMGVMRNELRLPMTPVSPALYRQLEDTLPAILGL
ncbi:4-hydroxy-tetrahydrodipicolinate synthase [Silvimonas iriomotensis]|uniref:4-hydroxy-tetrahydrodipicolinate synthase n=2 Tax=Silvimonas iriomotensis TaxID=449662 RepID=A0ABQ2PF93_9NEIS|nr:4-hydroxy-tetrahydrodipicolinate synthase [Silvimonas iriomotensis]